VPAPSQQSALDTARLGSPLVFYDRAGNIVISETAAKKILLAAADGSLGFFGTAPVAIGTLGHTAGTASQIIVELARLGLVTDSG
jgi:hypothetical protein